MKNMIIYIGNLGMVWSIENEQRKGKKIKRYYIQKELKKNALNKGLIFDDYRRLRFNF